ncbi:ATP-binding cassette domain-containing protein [Gleimia hominis]|uniref:ATP-binding cassette domain-containing protein n=1 Tax=Gleimia hominis TaxID=595468 RepID=UPI000C7F9364|nr:ATP-binding cassette domain-containing protein [Gleimia hominis]WIK64691.1 ATP-binding cassette domain-containing protein [Gleimia hominis]
MKLELRGITKVFGPLVANDHIDLTIEPGQIHALLGENGAGKSTLMNVLYGLYQPNDGQILIDNKPVSFSGPGDAVAAGIGMVHQHFMLVPVFTVAESVALGYEPTKVAGIIETKKARDQVRELSARFGFDIDPDAPIESLSVGAQQRVEIIKALSRDARVLILDEPTAVLTPQETDELMDIMLQLKAAGTSIVFITHKLREVRAVADHITVIRRGKVVGEASAESTEEELASMMVGRPVMLNVEKDEPNTSDVGLSLRNVSLVSKKGNLLLDDVNLDVRRGEVVCIAGVQGNGQTELSECLLGATAPSAGTIEIGGKDASGRTIKNRLQGGLGFVPEDRSKDGMIASFSIAENMILDQYDRPPFAKGINMRPHVVLDNAQKLREEYDVRVTSVTDPIATLSGGNAQKAILARELSRKLVALVASQPTRGLDVGSIEFVYKRIIEERDANTAVLVISTELDEVDALADRIAVMYRGKIVGIVPAGTPRSVLGLMMAGVPLEEAQQAASSGRLAQETAGSGRADGQTVGSSPAGGQTPRPSADAKPETGSEVKEGSDE